MINAVSNFSQNNTLQVNKKTSSPNFGSQLVMNGLEYTFAPNAPKKENNRRTFPAICSYVMPGLGQWMNGKTGKGFAFFLGNLGLMAGGLAAGGVATAKIIERGGPSKGSIALLAGTGAALMGDLALRISSSVSAYKDKDKVTKQDQTKIQI